MGKQKKVQPTPAGQSDVRKVPIWVFLLVGAAFLIFFLVQWLISLTNSYFNAFILRDSTVSEAAAHMSGLTPNASEQTKLLPAQKEWDLFTSARLRDEVRITAKDGTELHGYLYDEGSPVTVVVLPRFNLDGTADFLPGSALHELTGCNILLPDPRAHGESGGAYFGFGYLEQYDLAAWLTWAEQYLEGEQVFLLWGEGVGANTILFSAANGLLPDSAVLAVAESPYLSVHQLAEANLWKWYQLPAFPFLYTIENKLARSAAGFTEEDTELLPVLSGSDAALPVLFLRSGGDEYIRPEWTASVYDAYPGPKEMISGGLTHGTAFVACRTEILKWVEAIINEH